ncbi:MAG: glycosyltransferase family 9 protein [Bryobacteraceae bacterium]|nr:glycosyltransferase family 9 protein [Bryobacteraceae bacterium]
MSGAAGENVLAVRLDNIGDVVMLSPALRAMREAMPASRLTLLATKAGAKVAPLLPWVDAVEVIRPLWQDLKPPATAAPEVEEELISRLRAYDRAYIFTSFSQSPHPPALLLEKAGVPVRVGQSKERDSVLTHAIAPPPDDSHQTERSLWLLEQAGVRVARRELELRIPDEAERTAEERLRAAGIDPEEPYIAVAPGASCPSRRYPPAGFAAALRELCRETKMQAVVLGSESESGLAQDVLRGAERPLSGDLTKDVSVPVMAALIRRARLFLGNNSGGMHIADALRTPMVILYSGTELHEQFAPRSAAARLLTRPVPCQPCHTFSCPFRSECLDVGAGEVVRAALQVLAQ